MAKHTPGPWQLYEASAAESAILAPDGIQTRAPIALLIHTEKEEWENACLIRAAPEMFELLEVFVRKPDAETVKKAQALLRQVKKDQSC